MRLRSLRIEVHTLCSRLRRRVTKKKFSFLASTPIILFRIRPVKTAKTSEMNKVRSVALFCPQMKTIRTRSSTLKNHITLNDPYKSTNSKKAWIWLIAIKFLDYSHQLVHSAFKRRSEYRSWSWSCSRIKHLAKMKARNTKLRLHKKRGNRVCRLSR